MATRQRTQRALQIILVALALAAVALAAPSVDEPFKILRANYDSQPEGGYVFGFETENGINREETGEVKEAFDDDNKPHQVVVVRGSYSYTDEGGESEIVHYYADETGFHAEGKSIPQPPGRK